MDLRNKVELNFEKGSPRFSILNNELLSKILINQFFNGKIL